MSLFAYTLVAFILATAVATALFRDILSVIIVFGAYSSAWRSSIPSCWLPTWR